MKIDEIKVGKRYRKDLGDIDSLAESIKDRGLLHPIGITKDKQLKYGERRLEALKKLGIKELTEGIHYIVKDTDDIKADERHENIKREPFTPEEAVKVWQDEESYQGERTDLELGSDSERSPRKIARASKITGYSTDSLSKAKQVVESGDRELIDKMNKGMSIDEVYRKVKQKSFDESKSIPTSEREIPKSGTREWSDYSINIDSGCRHDCKYCYAKYDAINKYHSVKNEAEWIKPKRLKGFLDKVKKEEGRGMFPTTHDITPENVDDCISYLKKQLKVGNEILITSKPHLDCVKKICKELKDYKKQIMFRFTIGSYSNKVLKFWEPNTPSFEERLESLEYAFKQGFETSVSCEPILDGTIPIVVYKCSPFVTQTIWLGKMNEIESRVDKSNHNTPEFHMILQTIKLEFVQWLYSIYKDTPKIRWKESYKRLLNLPEQEIIE
ncbi:MAG: radical SAM protein [Actinobacteria bacterium]|nr:radical SAM protein [Actinomycetota bacterium]MBE3114833.1 radical SAM protein [Actinomycetota bacterium]